MGYSVYIILNKSEKELVNKFLDLLYEENSKNDIFGNNYVSFPSTQDLSYTDDKHKSFVGVNYGCYTIAHTFCRWLCKKLKKKGYWYDGVEFIDLHNAKEIEEDIAFELKDKLNLVWEKLQQ